MWLVILILAIIVIIGFIIWIVYTLLYSLLFFPIAQYIWVPTDKYSDIMIDGKLSAWHFDNFSDHKTVLFCHGNGGNISHREYIVEICKRQQLNLLLFDYRGFGKSPGIPSQRHICEDGERAYSYLRQSVPANKIVIWGESLGGAVATHIASKYPCSLLILMSTFSSLDDALRDRRFSPVTLAMSFLLPWFANNLASNETIKKVKAPIVIMHSPEDEIIPYNNAIKLYKAIPHKCKTFISISGKHCTPEITEEQFRKMFNFCCFDGTNCDKYSDILDILKKYVPAEIGKALDSNEPVGVCNKNACNIVNCDSDRDNSQSEMHFFSSILRKK